MTARQVGARFSELALVVGLAIAYGAAAAGLAGWINPRSVSLYALVGAAISFFAIVAYYAVSDREIRRRY
jgi:4-hydroxybenzoate polyprenyltransferase